MKAPVGGCLRSAQRATAEFTRANKAKVAATTRRMANQSGRPWRMSKRFITVVSGLRSPQRLEPTAVPPRRDEAFRICEADLPEKEVGIGGLGDWNQRGQRSSCGVFQSGVELG